MADPDAALMRVAVACESVMRCGPRALWNRVRGLTASEGSYLIGARLPVDAGTKLRLLRCRDPMERLKEEVRWREGEKKRGEKR